MRTNTVELYVRPNARDTRVEGLFKDRIKIRIAASPEKGKANKELIDYISSLTGVKKGNIRIISGITSNYKKVSIDGGTVLDYSKVLLDNSLY